MNTDGDWRYSYTIIDLALDGGGLPNSHPGRFVSGERGSVTQWVGGWVGLRVCLNAMKKRIYFSLTGNGTPAVQPVA
jgi:hypothetical protein